jgi:1-acyl-sn-glycerol-3-phosphate acyltransferase
MELEATAGPRPKRVSTEIRGWYGLARSIIGFLLRLLSRLEVHGLQHIPEQGPYLLITNHLHWLDPPLLMVICPHQVRVFAAEKWEKHLFLGPLFRSVDAIFVRRGEVDRVALRKALAVLHGGGVLGLAPEGTRSRSGVMQKGRSGAAYMAYHTGVPVVPVSVSGQEKVVRSLFRFHRARVRVVVGQPFRPAPPASGNKASAAEVHAFTEEMMYHLAAMLPAEYRGVYSDVLDKYPELVAEYDEPAAAHPAILT